MKQRLPFCTEHGNQNFKDPTDLTDESLSYGIVLDCGSSGTRVYIYYWPPHNGDKHQLLDIHQLIGNDGKPLSKKITPGKIIESLSSTSVHCLDCEDDGRQLKTKQSI